MLLTIVVAIEAARRTREIALEMRYAYERALVDSPMDTEQL